VTPKKTGSRITKIETTPAALGRRDVASILVKLTTLNQGSQRARDFDGTGCWSRAVIEYVNYITYFQNYIRLHRER